jgi:anti-sigma factor RsiW
MTLRTAHIAEEELLLHADGELAGRGAARVRAHLEGCADCRARLSTISNVLSESAAAYRVDRPAMDELINGSGPRALLRARLADESLRTSRSGWRHLGLGMSLAGLCAGLLLAVTGFQIYQTNHRHAVSEAAMTVGMLPLLPNPGITPGSTRPVTLAEVCAADRDEVVREVPASLQQKVFQEYGIKDRPAKDFEVDYLITPGLGGSDDVSNLWPEPHSEPVWNSYVKDQLEDHLHHMVCHGQLSLSDAQREIAGNWISAYKKYFHTDRPVGQPSPTALSQI